MTNRLLLTIVLLLATSPVLALGPQPADDFLADAVRPGLGATLSFDALPEPPPAPESRSDTVPAVKTPAYNRQQAALFNKLIHQVAREHQLDPQLLHAIVTVESGYNPGATSPKGAQGLMQLMPDTAARFGVRNRADPLQSLRGGARYLRFLQGYFKQDMTLVIAAYNAGEGAVGKYRNTVPPYRETRDYVAKVLASYESRAGQPLVPSRQPRFQLILPPPRYPL
ncbi:lytic transglycosylase domain-containing protein [Vogesella indigofera]|uniref:lytic transglycosylase domain-containing protein n=1 Tax=Vogesella indigofera TaxID=45465 RepID=UPI00234F06A1|nr:lytic transglycosylase domain-containing protein [Vogesella indigofera]MDC7709190.1 lytic transglycosylase domain-containing protein [Vogesella indigofera]